MNTHATHPALQTLNATWEQAFAADLAAGAPPVDETPGLDFTPCPNCPFVGGSGEAEFAQCALCVVVSLAAAPEPRD